MRLSFTCQDATIALYIIDKFISSNFYTVHDNFIVNPHLARTVCRVYTSAFQSLGDPLSQVNLYLYHNIIRHSSLCSSLISQEFSSYVTLNQILDRQNDTNLSCAKSLLHVLEQALKELVPANLKSQDLATWEKKSRMLLDSYESYVNSLESLGGELVGYPIRYHSFLEKLQHTAAFASYSALVHSLFF